MHLQTLNVSIILPRSLWSRSLTPYCTQNELHRGVWLVIQVQTDGDGTLRHQDGPDVMQRGYRTDLHPVDQLENVHAHQHLRAHDQYIP